MRFRVVSLLLATALLASCAPDPDENETGTPKGVPELIDALNAGMTNAEATMTWGKMAGTIGHAMVFYGDPDMTTGSKRLELQFDWCSYGPAPARKKPCAWVGTTVTVMLKQVDASSIAIKPEGDKLTVTLACEKGRECQFPPERLGIPCRDQPTCEKLRDNLGKVVRFGHDKPIEPPVV